MSKLLLVAVLALQLLQVAANAECIDCGSERIKPVRALSDASYCQFPGACDRSTPGTGHKNFTGNLREDLITVERCYSFCFKNVREHALILTLFMVYVPLAHLTFQFSSSSGSAVDPFPDIFTGDPCLNKDVSRHFTARLMVSVYVPRFCAYVVCVCRLSCAIRLACLAPRTLWNVSFLKSQCQTMQHVNTTVH